MLNNDALNALTRYLDITARRQQLVAENIANVDTPGYHTKDLRFGDALRTLLDDADEQLRAYEVPGLVERPDGNNVSVDREGLLMGETQMQFNVGVQLMKAEFHKLSLAINEGRL